MTDDQIREKQKLPELKQTDDSAPQQAAFDLSHVKSKNSPERLIGKMIGQKYRIDEVLGTGGLGVVYKGYDLLLSRPVAIKTLFASHELDAKALLRFQREAQAAIRLKHPNIVSVQDFGIYEGTPYLIMEYVEGCPLSTLTGEGALEPDRALRLLRQLCSGLALAHKNGIVHRDVKPQNLIVTKLADGTEQLEIIDFGIARFVDREDAKNITQTGEIFGTPNYMSPEQCTGKQADQTADVYSAGCVAFEMFAGKPPFSGDSTFEVLMKHVEEPAPVLEGSKLPRGVSIVIERALEKEPSKRYATAQEMLDDVDLVMSGRSPERHGRRIKKKRSAKQVFATMLKLTLLFCLTTNLLVFPWISSRMCEHAKYLKEQQCYGLAANVYGNAWLISFYNYDANLNAAVCDNVIGTSQRATAENFDGIFGLRRSAINAGLAALMRSQDYRPYLYRAIANSQMHNLWSGSDLTNNDKAGIIADYRQAISLNSSNLLNNQTIAYTDLAWFLNDVADYTAAKEEAEKAISLDRDFPEAWSAKAAANFELHQFEQAVKDANTALGYERDLPSAILTRARANLRLKKYGDVRHDVESLLQSSDKYYIAGALNVRILLDKAEGKDSKKDEARSHRLRFIQTHPLVNPN